MELLKVEGDLKLQGCTIVLPAVAFANIGELAVDVLISTLKAQLVARLDNPNLLACVGNNAYQPQPPGLLATPLELYHVPGTTIYLLQQRAPAIPGRQKAFAAEVSNWAQQAGVGHVLLLCGLDAQYRREQQLEGTQLRFLDSSTKAEATRTAGDTAEDQPRQQEQPQGEASSAGAANSCSAAGLMQLEPDVIETERELHGLLPPWPLLDALEAQGVQHTLMATFAAEGDNAQDGLQLASKVIAVLHLQGWLAVEQQDKQQQVALGGAGEGSPVSGSSLALQVPCSWVGLFGRSTIDAALF